MPGAGLRQNESFRKRRLTLCLINKKRRVPRDDESWLPTKKMKKGGELWQKKLK